MKKVLIAFAVYGLTLLTAGCYTPSERALGGAAIGGVTGAAIGGIATGNIGGAAAGGAIGAVTGGIIGSALTPSGPECPYGAYQDAYGNVYCQ
jgi:osmotically inducible lipoprotein OsmB